MTTMLSPNRPRSTASGAARATGGSDAAAAASAGVAPLAAPAAVPAPAGPRPARRPSGPRRLPRQRGAGCVVASAPGRELAAAPGALATRHRARTAVVRPVRLTRRGLAAVAVLTGVVAAALVWVAWLSAPSPAPAAAGAPATVTVQPGDTLWTIAGSVAPGRDPRAEVALLQRLNHLAGSELAVGQQLRTR